MMRAQWLREVGGLVLSNGWKVPAMHSRHCLLKRIGAAKSLELCPDFARSAEFLNDRREVELFVRKMDLPWVSVKTNL